MGKELSNTVIPVNSTGYVLDNTSLAQGIYLCRMVADNKVLGNLKIVIIR